MNGQVRAFLVDGFVAGFWKVAEEKRKAALILEPFRALTKKETGALSAEGKRLLKFAAPEAKITAVKLGNAY